jgi:LacI family transcriptional regulator
MKSRGRRLRKVALLIETTRSYTREILSGVRRFLSARGPWSAFLELRALESTPPEWLKGWDGEGILTRTYNRRMSELIDAIGIPAVELRSTHFRGVRPFVGMDNAEVGRLAAEHLLNQGYREMAVYGLRSELFFEERVRNFISTVRARGGVCEQWMEEDSDRTEDWEGTQERLMGWVRGLPKPVGVFAANDQLAVRVLDACRRLDLGVPEDVAVLGAENEETLCGFATPALSSVALDGESVGYRAAELLERMMEGEAPGAGEVLVPPRGVVVRASSDAFAITDRLVASAARLIRENATSGLNVAELCRRLNASRSTLDRRMKAVMQRTPKAEIQRVRFMEVERLLRDTDLTVEEIAFRTGFAHSQYLHAAFWELRRMTPGQFRKKTQAPG